jgi:hypothetical protein
MSKLEAYLGHPYDQELNYDQTFNQNTYLGKVDANVGGGRHHLSIRDNYTNFENANNQTLRHLSNQGTEHDKFNQLVGQLNSTLNSRTVNQFLVEVLRDERPIDPATPTNPEVSIANITSSSSVFFGRNDSLPNNTIEKKVQVKDSIQFVQGRHTLKVGTDLLFMNIDNLFARNINSLYAYTNPSAFVSNTTTTFSQGYGPGAGHTIWSQNTYAFFATDNIRVNKRLTVDAGLRYDWQTMPLPDGNVYPQHPEFVTQIQEDRNNWAPRLGFAYDLTNDGRTVLRGGTGVFYGYMPDILLSNPLTQISGNFSQVQVTCGSATRPLDCPTFPNIYPPNVFTGSAVTAVTNIVTVGSAYQAQQSWRSSVQVERQLRHGYTVAASGTWASMKNVQGSRNINAVASGITLGDVPLYNLTDASRKYTDLGVVRELCSCETASYKALVLETHRLALADSPISWDFSYTLSKAIDDETNERSTSTSFLYDPFNPSLSEGPSDNDVRHRIVADAVYATPLWGINLAAIYTWRTGVPYTPGIGFSQTGVPGSPTSLSGLSQTTGDIPIYISSSGGVIDLTQLGTPTRQQFSDLLSAQGARIIGRNAYRQPNFHNVDFRISKDINVSKTTRVQLLLEVFNLINTRNLLVGTDNVDQYLAKLTQTSTNPGTYSFTSFPNFGKVNTYSGASDPRQFQVAAKIFF